MQKRNWKFQGFYKQYLQAHVQCWIWHNICQKNVWWNAQKSPKDKSGDHNFTAKQVMSVTDHKSINSLAIYQKVRENDKLSMGISLTYSLINQSEVPDLEIIEKECHSLKSTPVSQTKGLPAPEPLQPVPASLSHQQVKFNKMLSHMPWIQWINISCHWIVL